MLFGYGPKRAVNDHQTDDHPNGDLDKWRKQINQYEKLVSDPSYYTLRGDTVGDVLYMLGVRDDIHATYAAMKFDDRGRVADVDHLRALDKTLRHNVKKYKDTSFIWTLGEKNEEWWYKLDRLDELSDDDLLLI